MTWPVVPLNDLQADEPRAITDGPFGSNLASRHYTDHGPRVVRLQNIGDGSFVDEKAHISQEHFESLRAHEVLAGDLLVASLGGVLPRACLAPSTLGPAIVKADCIRVRLRGDVEPRWVMYAVQRPEVRRWAENHRHGVGRPRLGLKVIRQIPVPLPPLDEQRRIVELLEDHLSRLDAARESVNTSIRRSSALVTSSLSATVAAGSAGSPLSTVGAEAERVEYGSSARCHTQPSDGDIPVLRMGNLKDGQIDPRELKFLPKDHPEFPKLLLAPGDLLFNRTNSAELVGKSAVFESASVTSFASYLLRVRFSASVDPRWANIVINSPQGRAHIASVATQQVGQANVNGTKLKAFPLPMPSLARQRELAAACERIFDDARRLSVVAEDSLRRSAALRRSLLAAAFSGQLTTEMATA